MITKAANQRNAERYRRETIARDAPALWDNICRAVEQAFQYYNRMDSGLPVDFSGRANHTIWVAVFERKTPPSKAKGPERERVTITFNQTDLVIEVRSSLSGTVRKFPIDLDGDNHIRLLDENRNLIPAEDFAEQFTAIVLHDAFFPPDQDS